MQGRIMTDNGKNLLKMVLYFGMAVRNYTHICGKLKAGSK
jgi:hypothetical protein